MEIGDLIYVILLLLFMILGFFNDSRKKKEQEKQQGFNPDFSTNDKEIIRTVPPILSSEQQRNFELEKEKKLRQLNRGKEKFAKEGEVVFKSSMDLITDFSKESSLKGSIYRNDAGSLYDVESEIFGTYSEEPDSPEMPDVFGDARFVIHPLIEDMFGVNRRRELAKGLIYGEILNKKY